MNGPDAPNWEAACRAEMDSLGRHEAADPVPEDTLPTWDRAKRRASEVVHTFWVLKNKYVNGTCEKYKARLVFDAWPHAKERRLQQHGHHHGYLFTNDATCNAQGSFGSILRAGGAKCDIKRRGIH